MPALSYGFLGFSLKEIVQTSSTVPSPRRYNIALDLTESAEDISFPLYTVSILEQAHEAKTEVKTNYERCGHLQVCKSGNLLNSNNSTLVPGEVSKDA